MVTDALRCALELDDSGAKSAAARLVGVASASEAAVGVPAADMEREIEDDDEDDDEEEASATRAFFRSASRRALVSRSAAFWSLSVCVM